jgi:hypothetical protein
MTQKDELVSTDWDPDNEDDVHKCTDKRPTASVSYSGAPGATEEEEGHWTVTAHANFGTFKLSSYELRVNGVLVKSGALGASSDTITYETTVEPKNISFRVTDAGGYVTTASK